MLAICLRDFRDGETGELRHEGDVFEVTAERLEAINSTKYGTLASEYAQTPKPKAPRRTRKAKTEE